jgi:hypothetical protein
MCRVEWGRAIVEAQRLSDPSRPGIAEVVDVLPGHESARVSPLVEDQVIRNQEARVAEPQLA